MLTYNSFIRYCMTEKTLKGFKRDGKFIPTDNSRQSVVHSSDINSNKLKNKNQHEYLAVERFKNKMHVKLADLYYFNQFSDRIIGKPIIVSNNGVTFSRGSIGKIPSHQLSKAKQFDWVLVNFDNGTSQFMDEDDVILDAKLPLTHPAIKEFAKERQQSWIKQYGKKSLDEHIQKSSKEGRFAGRRFAE